VERQFFGGPQEVISYLGGNLEHGGSLWTARCQHQQNLQSFNCGLLTPDGVGSHPDKKTGRPSLDGLEAKTLPSRV
jgi:hypothetical protein